MYKKIWIAFVNIAPLPGFNFNELVSAEDIELCENYIGAWANILIKSDSINEALKVIPRGLAELKFIVSFIDKIENLETLVDNNEIQKEVVEEADWLIGSSFVFKISDRLFPYC